MFKTPRQLPDLASIVADLDSRRARDIADYLGVSERSVFGWLASGQCPRPAHLALFWVTRWGASIIDAETANGERFARAALVAAQTENATLRGQVAYLERLHTGAANGPLFTFWAFSQIARPDFGQVSALPPRIFYRGFRRPI